MYTGVGWWDRNLSGLSFSPKKSVVDGIHMKMQNSTQKTIERETDEYLLLTSLNINIPYGFRPKQVSS